ncbi:hypothetical protein [Aeromicrobium sp. P5_D10]
MSRRLTAGLAVCLFLLFGTAANAASSPYPRTLEDIVAGLRQDPIMVHTAMGTGDADGVHDLLTDLAAKVDVPVYVVLSSTPDELSGAERPAEQATAVLQQALGDGLYIVKFNDGPSHIAGYGAAKDLDFNPGQRAYTRARDMGPYEYNVPTAALQAELVLRSAADPGQEISDSTLRGWLDSPRAFQPDSDDSLADLLAKRWVYATGAGVAVLLGCLTLVWLSIKAPLRTRRDPKEEVAGPPSQFDAEELPRAQARYDKLPAAQLGSPHATAAEEALTAADLVAATGDGLDQIGAWVLARQADRELDRISRSSLAPFVPCMINPEHGEAGTTVRLAGSSIDAPVCRRCGNEQGEFLTASTWRGERSYLDTRTVWARTGFGALVDDLARQVIADRSVRR